MTAAAASHGTTGDTTTSNNVAEKGDNNVLTAAAAGGEEEEVVISAPVHCDGCARKLRRSLQRIDGVGEVEVDRRANTVVVRGRKAVQSAAEAVEVVERKTGAKAALLSLSPEKLPPSAVKMEKTMKVAADEDVNTEEIAEEDMYKNTYVGDIVDYKEMVVLLRMNLHCDACCEEIKRRILKIKGVEDAVPQLKSSQIMVKGTVEPATLVSFIHKCTGRKAAITRAEPLHLLPLSESPPPPPPPTDAPPLTEAKPKQNDASDNLEAKLDGEKQEKNGRGQDDVTAGGGQDDNGNEKAQVERPSDDHGAEEQRTTHDEVPNSEVVEKMNHKNDHLFSVPLPAGVVAVAPEMALNTLDPYYCYQTYPAHPYHYHYAQPYPYYCDPAMYGYGYGYPHYQSAAFSEENPDACTIM
ncbi:hypothetical protein ACP70R_023216 [Stipagrostis hirtigluma subsp. patula]